jgi:hypothetical protein
MSKIQVNDIVNHYDTGAPQFPKGIAVGSGATLGLNVGTGASIYSPSDNVLTLGTNNEERVRVDSDGRVLLGGATSSNTERLYVKGSSSTTSGIFIHNANGATNSSADLWFGNWSGSTSGTPQARISVLNKNVNTAASDLIFSLYDGNDTLERLRVTSGGNVNIGGEYSQTDSKVSIVDASRPIAEATLNLQSSTTSGAADTGPVLRFYGHSGSEGRYHASIKGAKENGTSGNTAGYLAFNTRPAGGAMVERVRLTSTGCAIISSTGSFSPYVADANLQITDDTNAKLVINNPGNSSYSLAVGTDNNLKFRNESTAVDSILINYSTNNLEIVDGNLKVASGHGIDFSATNDPGGMTSELLDDYEEGTWTPTIGGNATYTNQVGTYVKVGRMVYAHWALTINAQGTGSNISAIDGLPYPSGVASQSTSNLLWSGFGVSMAYAAYYVGNASTLMNLSYIATAATALTNNPNGLVNGATMNGTIVYYSSY